MTDIFAIPVFLAGRRGRYLTPLTAVQAGLPVCATTMRQVLGALRTQTVVRSAEGGFGSLPLCTL